MIKCIYYEKDEGWCMNRDIDMYLDYPSEHYCKGCYHYREEEKEDEGIPTNEKQ